MVNDTSGTLEAQQALLRDLRVSERLLWSGIPVQGLRFQDGDALMIPFTLFWCAAFVLPDYLPGWHKGFASDGFDLVAFVAIVPYLLVGRYLYDRYRRARTYYGVTDRRVVIIEQRWGGRETTDMSLTGLWELSLKERADKSGTITFGPPNPVFSARGGAKKRSPTFQIEDVRRVYDLIRDAQVAARREASARH